jgi:hypothetical protein
MSLKPQPDAGYPLYRKQYLGDTTTQPNHLYPFFEFVISRLCGLESPAQPHFFPAIAPQTMKKIYLSLRKFDEHTDYVC